MMVTIDIAVINNDIPFIYTQFEGYVTINMKGLFIQEGEIWGEGGKIPASNLMRWRKKKYMSNIFTGALVSIHAPGIYGYVVGMYTCLLFRFYHDHLIETTPSSRLAIRLKAEGERSISP